MGEIYPNNISLKRNQDMSSPQVIIQFPGGQRVDATYGSNTIPTDQPPPYGEGSAPTPFDLFLSSIGTCAGIYVLNFCRQRDLPTDGIRLIQQMERDESTRLITNIKLEIELPPTFPEKYRQALIRAADHCAVKRHLENPPQIKTLTRVIE
jgi:ribosomal protein S12 methylthiotransferase accessory factor